MITLIYENQKAERFRHDTFCFSHLYQKDYFDEECELESIPITYDTLESVTVKPRANWILNKDQKAYRDLVYTYLVNHVNPSFTFTFHPNDPKLYILFVAGFLRVMDEEDLWFVEAMGRAKGTLIQRLAEVYKEMDTQLFMWSNPLHQVMLQTITYMTPEDINIFSDHWDSWLTYLMQSTPPMLGSKALPEYEDTMDFHAMQFLKEVKCTM